MYFRLSSLFAVSLAAGAIVITSVTPARSIPSYKCSFTRSYHASRCVRQTGAGGNLVVNAGGQIANTAADGAYYICPIAQTANDANPTAWPEKWVQLDGYANASGITAQICAVSAQSGIYNCEGLTEVKNGVYHKSFDASWVYGYDYMYLLVIVKGTNAGSSNTIFGYSITSYGNEHSTC